MKYSAILQENVLPTDINECASSPCKNGGICTNQVNKYSCTCPTDWGGRKCGVGECNNFS